MHFSLVRTVELLCFRMWSVLIFPINWAVRSQLWLSTACLLFVGTASVNVFLSRPTRKRILAAIAFAMLAILPASHLALLDSSLSGSRVYHLSVVGIALLVGAIYEGFDNKQVAVLMILGTLVFQSAALIHNLLIWRDTAYLAQRTCSTFAGIVGNGEAVVVSSLPSKHKGVFFLSNGFADCVYVNSGKQPVILSSPMGEYGQRIFAWDENSESIKKIH